MYSAVPGLGKMLYKAWHESCAERYDDQKDLVLLQQCAGTAGVFRPMAVAALFFAVQAIVTKVQPSLNREAWPAKYVMFFFAVFVTFFMGNAPLFTGVFLVLARLGATFFVILQQGAFCFGFSLYGLPPTVIISHHAIDQDLHINLSLFHILIFSTS